MEIQKSFVFKWKIDQNLFLNGSFTTFNSECKFDEHSILNRFRANIRFWVKKNYKNSFLNVNLNNIPFWIEIRTAFVSEEKLDYHSIISENSISITFWVAILRVFDFDWKHKHSILRSNLENIQFCVKIRLTNPTN